jgi:hypothetical protein
LQIVVNINENAWPTLKFQQKIGKTAKITSRNKRDPRKSAAYSRRDTRLDSLSRPYTPLIGRARKDVDTRDKRGHDE